MSQPSVGLASPRRLAGTPQQEGFAGWSLPAASWAAQADRPEGGVIGVLGGGPAVIGALPTLARQAGKLKVFISDPAWVLPEHVPPTPAKPVWLLRWAATRHLHRQIDDAWLRRQLLPGGSFDRARAWTSNDYYPALSRENCELVFWPIDRLCPQGVRTCDGLIHALDGIVFGD